jgi:hypothetical protein
MLFGMFELIGTDVGWLGIGGFIMEGLIKGDGEGLDDEEEGDLVRVGFVVELIRINLRRVGLFILHIWLNYIYIYGFKYILFYFICLRLFVK